MAKYLFGWELFVNIDPRIGFEFDRFSESKREIKKVKKTLEEAGFQCTMNAGSLKIRNS